MQFLYQFTVHNTTSPQVLEPQSIVDWELPLWSFQDIDFNTIVDPPGWTHEILNGKNDVTGFYNNPNGLYGNYKWDWTAANDPTLQADPNAYGPGAGVFENPPVIIHWVTTLDANNNPTDPICVGQSRGGFSFISDFNFVPAPYVASWFFANPTIGDPPIPGQAFGTPNSPARQAAQAIPEPGTLVLLSIGALLLMGYAWWRRQQTAR